MNKSEYYANGYDDYFDGGICPYPLGTAAHVDWWEGFIDAEAYDNEYPYYDENGFYPGTTSY